jgi:type III secretory pathway lipoprotein EscJ
VSIEPELVTVYRSMDASAKDDAENILTLLRDSGIQAVMLDDSAPGVPEGVFEVRVPAATAAEAEALIAENPEPDEVEAVDPSSQLNLETLVSGVSEMEAIGVKNLLESNGIAAVLVGDSVLPNLAFEVRVARDQVDRARTLIADAEAIGPAAAEEAELESESGS